MRFVITALLFSLAASFAAGCTASDEGSSAEEPSGSPEAFSETMTTPEEHSNLSVEQLSSEAPGQGVQQPEAVIAPSAAALSEASGQEVADSGEGTYLAVFWGEKPTGGYSVAVEEARIERESVTVRLALEEPPPGAILTQALTYPYAVALARDLDPAGKEFSFEDQEGRELDWPVRQVGS